MLTQAQEQTRIMSPSDAEAAPPEPDDMDIDALVAAHQTPLLRYAQRLIRSEESAQDVVQETFLRYLKSPPRDAETPRRIANWLYRVTHNLCVDLIRKEQRMREACEQIDHPAPAPLPSDGVAAEETRRRIDGLLDRLTENQRTVLVLKVQEGKSYREISEITGLSASNVGFLIHRGMKKMAELVRQEEPI